MGADGLVCFTVDRLCLPVLFSLILIFELVRGRETRFFLLPFVVPAVWYSQMDRSSFLLFPIFTSCTPLTLSTHKVVSLSSFANMSVFDAMRL